MPNNIGENQAKRKIEAGELVLCLGVNQMRTPNIGMIAAACGFDAIYIDLEHDPTSLETSDLRTEMGSPGQYRHKRMREAYEKTAKATRAHDNWMGVGGVREDFEFQTWLIQLGMRYLTGGSDVGYILSAGRADVKRLREVPLS